MNLEWDVPYYLIPSRNPAGGTSPELAALPMNLLASVGTTPLGFFLLDSAKCQAGAARRITRNNLAQADGEITHRKFKSGYVFELNVQLWERIGSEGLPACRGTLREMGDLLAEYLEAIANADGQLVWQPSPWPDDQPPPNRRLLDSCRSMGPSGSDGGSFVSVVTEKDAENPLTTVTFALLSPLPYTTDYMDWPVTPDATATFATGGGDLDVVVTNEGNVPYQPVIRVYGPASVGVVDGFTLTNHSAADELGNALRVVYDTSLPGASGLGIPVGGYVEIDTFRSTVKLHQPGGGTDNAKSAIDVLNTDFFELEPGSNSLSLAWSGPTGLKAEVVYRNAWA